MLYVVAHSFLNGQSKNSNFSVTRATRKRNLKKPWSSGDENGYVTSLFSLGWNFILIIWGFSARLPGLKLSSCNSKRRFKKICSRNRAKNSARLTGWNSPCNRPLRVTTRIRNAQRGPLLSVFDKVSVFYCKFPFTLNFSFKENDENLQFWGLGLVSSQVDTISGY